jgi:hypothetical protein
VRKRGFLALFALLGLAGCGGGGGNQTAAVEQAVKTSPLTYYHFAGATWWGRPVRVQLMVTRMDKDQATAVVKVSSGGKVIANQTLLLQKNGGQWAVSGSEVTGTAAETDFGDVTGPVATRPPTAAEAAAIRAGALKSFPGEGDCLQFIVAVSKVDPAWASAVIKFVGPHRIRCATTGTPVMHKGAAGWKMVAVQNGVMACSAATAGVIRSLFGRCRIVGAKG